MTEFDAYNESAIARLCMTSLTADASPSDLPSVRFRIPLVIPEGIFSGDGRKFAQGSLTTRPMPLALMWQPSGEEGHKGSVIVGRIDHVEKVPTGLGNAYGVFDSGEHGQEALRLVRAGMLRGISADLDEFEAELQNDDELKKTKKDTVSAQKMLVQKGRLMGATLVAKPAFAECTIELIDGDNMTDGIYTADSDEARVAALIASAAPLAPPREWFDDPELDRPAALTVTEDGQVFGHIAAWDVDHIGLPFGTRAPRSASNYSYFRTGVVRTAEGDDVTVGQLTLAGGHASLEYSAQAAVKHYDDTKSAVADLACGEDRYGIWVAGALRPEVTPEQVRALRAAAPSGDWRPIRGKLELVAVCQVNVPGFPIARARVASGMVQALVAAGAAPLLELKVQRDSSLSARIELLELSEKRRLTEEAERVRLRMAPVFAQRQLALTAAAEQARLRMAPRRAELAAAQDALNERRQIALSRVAALRPVVAHSGTMEYVGSRTWQEAKHPRGEHGHFAQILADLSHALRGHDQHDVNQAVNKLELATQSHSAGDIHGAHGHGTAAHGHLKDAIRAPENLTHKATLQHAHDDLGSVLHSLVEAHRRDKAVHFGDLPPSVQAALRRIVPLLPQNHALQKFVTPGGSSGFSNGSGAGGGGSMSPAQLASAVAQALATLSTGTAAAFGKAADENNKKN